jgi:hypothetical protein
MWDGKVQEINRLEPIFEVKQLDPMPVLEQIQRGFKPGEVVNIKTDAYRLDRLRGEGRDYWFYILTDINGDEWIEKLIDGYQAKEVNRDV